MAPHAPPQPTPTAVAGWPARAWPGQRELHVWRFSSDWLQGQPASLAALLSCDERERLERLPQEGKRAAFVQVRVAVRLALATYLGGDPAALTFARGVHGKPELQQASGLQFSLSHSGGCMLLAVAADSPVGVDLETVPRRSRDALAERLLGPTAHAGYAALETCARDEAFAWAWSEREAFVKAMGLGIGDGWQLAHGLFARLPLVTTPPAGTWRGVGGWVLHYLPAWPGYAAVACSGRSAEHVELLDPQLHGKEVPSVRLGTQELS